MLLATGFLELECFLNISSRIFVYAKLLSMKNKFSGFYSLNTNFFVCRTIKVSQNPRNDIEGTCGGFTMTLIPRVGCLNTTMKCRNNEKWWRQEDWWLISRFADQTLTWLQKFNVIFNRDDTIHIESWSFTFILNYRVSYKLEEVFSFFSFFNLQWRFNVNSNEFIRWSSYCFKRMRYPLRCYLFSVMHFFFPTLY